MYDGPEQDAEALPLGERYSGQRKPSLIFAALEHDLLWLRQKAYEDGFGIVEGAEPFFTALAWQALCLKYPEFDAPISSDDDEGWLGDSEVESLSVAHVIDNLISALDSYTPNYTRYGWLSDDPETDDFEFLGVWIDWDKLERDLENGKIVRIDDPLSLTYEEAAVLRDGGADFGLWDEVGDLSGALELHHLSSMTMEWSA